MEYTVERIDRQTANEWVVKKHYRKTLGVFWEAFALIKDEYIHGVCVFGQPSASIQKYAFQDRDFRLYELTRLVVQTEIKNAASYLVSQSLNMLKEKPCAVISYADSSMGHCGIIYQATNWIYTGAVKAHDKFYIVNGEKLHAITIRDRYGVTSPVAWAKENNIEMVKPKEKHRYFYFLGTRKQKKVMKSKLKYDIVDTYPKADKVLYDDGPILITKMKSLI